MKFSVEQGNFQCNHEHLILSKIAITSDINKQAGSWLGIQKQDPVEISQNNFSILRQSDGYWAQEV